jgi:hypothetical protein
MNNLSDVICKKCNRIIGQRDHNSFYRFGRHIIDKSGTIPCHFIDCGHNNPFRANPIKEKIVNNKIKIDKDFLTM